MTTDTWEQVLKIHEDRILDICRRAVMYARLDDALSKIAADFAAGNITLEKAVDMATEAASQVEGRGHTGGHSLFNKHKSNHESLSGRPPRADEGIEMTEKV